MNKRLQTRTENRLKILNAISTRPEGILSIEISELTGIPVNIVKRMLVALRDNGVIASKKVPKPQRKTQLWFKVNTTPVISENKSGVPYPDLDKTHEEWCKQAKKPIYNPWERSCP